MEALGADDPRDAGPYPLLARLGRGGMGQVFLGRSPGGRLVAVKIVHRTLAGDPEFRRRFALEVDAARRVGGFYTAQVVDAGTDADPPWLVTAYIPGPSLQEAVAAHGPLPPDVIRVLGSGLAEGLAAVHASAIVHRDLKPANVLIAEDGPRVIDFGIARALDAVHHSTLVSGTAGFMSPEQALGETTGPPGDVFSLGCVLAFAATGRGPFGTGRPAALAYRVVYREPDLSGMPAELLPLMRECLAKDPAARPSLADVLARLGGEDAIWPPPALGAMISERRRVPVPVRRGPSRATRVAVAPARRAAVRSSAVTSPATSSTPRSSTPTGSSTPERPAASRTTASPSRAAGGPRRSSATTRCGTRSSTPPPRSRSSPACTRTPPTSPGSPLRRTRRRAPRSRSA
ncbi:hypothetical protein Pen01_30160 [Phytomonospora endophytica]|nr:hypothetical protein Pen01_30160 [Phytomonospora endophytica]